MKTSSYESILNELVPLRERRDYGTQGFDAIEQNALSLIDKGLKLPMELELRLRKKYRKSTIDKIVSMVLKQTVIKQCPKKDLTDDRPKSDQQWCLYDSKGEKLLGRHPTKEKAENQERAIQIHKHMN
jgi:hypothetical protein